MISAALRSRVAALTSGLLLALLLALPARADGEAALTCERIPQLLEAFFQKHITYGYLTEELRERTIDAYLKRLDPSKTLFLDDEAKKLRADLMGIFHDVYSGDCSRLEALQQEILRRYKETEDFVRQLVSRDDYAVDPDVMLILDPDKRGYPKTIEDLHRLHTKLVHFHMSNYLNSDVSMAEAKKKLIHRYELMTRRASELQAADIYAAFVDAFATSLDPHSHYLSADVLEDFQIDMRLSLDGIGVALSSRDGYSVVEKVIPGGAADRLAVLQPKDKVIAVAQEGEGDFVDVIDMDLRDVVRLIRGKRGTKVYLKVLREAQPAQRFTVAIVRDKIDLEERSAQLRFEQVKRGERNLKLAVIDLPSFYGDRNPAKRQSSRDLRNLLAKVRDAKADGLLFDLSRNGGGLLETAVEIAGFFIEDGGVVAVKGSDSDVNVLTDPDGSILYSGPMVVLVSRVSASASEIVAGAMKDYHRAVIVGDDDTFGKGTVQSMVPLPPGLGALKVTTALFFRPGGESTQHTGVASDVVIPSLSNMHDYGEAFQPYSLPAQTIPPFVHDPLRASDGGKLPWQVVTPGVVSELTRLSKERVDKSPVFAQIEQQIAQDKAHDGVIHLAELLQENEKAKAEQASSGPGDASVAPPPKDDDESEEPTPQQLEAIQVLADYVALGS